jgi:hypothetical protein
MQRYPGLFLALGSALEYRTTLGRVLSGHLGRQRGGRRWRLFRSRHSELFRQTFPRQQAIPARIPRSGGATAGPVTRERRGRGVLGAGRAPDRSRTMRYCKGKPTCGEANWLELGQIRSMVECPRDLRDRRDLGR